MQSIPPLNAVRAFDATVRAGTFSGAAKELGVSGAAISQHIRNLESYFRKKLFIRRNNRIILTDAGQLFYQSVENVLANLAEASARVMGDNYRLPIVVSAPFTLIEGWLLPTIGSIIAQRPQIGVDVLTESDPIDIKRRRIDVRVSYGNQHYPEWRAILLMHLDVIPVCSPEFLLCNPETRLDRIDDTALIHTDWGANFASAPNWSDWFRQAGIQRTVNYAQGKRVTFANVALAAAKNGMGIALAPTALLRPCLQDGSLIALSETSLRLDHAIYACCSETAAKREEVQMLIGALKRQGIDRQAMSLMRSLYLETQPG